MKLNFIYEILFLLFKAIDKVIGSKYSISAPIGIPYAILETITLVFSNNFDDLDLVKEDSDCYYYTNDAIDEEVIEQMLDKVTIDNAFEMYVLTNSYGINGASVLLYNGILESFANKLNNDLYILPSSVHEVILIPKIKDMSATELNDMVCEINSTQVPREDVLANCIYEYSHKKKAIMIVNSSGKSRGNGD